MVPPEQIKFTIAANTLNIKLLKHITSYIRIITSTAKIIYTPTKQKIASNQDITTHVPRQNPI